MQRDRWAVSALFLTNGAMFSTVLPRLPEIKDALELTDGQLGLALVGSGVGGLLGSTATRWLLPRLGSRRLAVASTLFLTVAVPLIGLAPVPAVLFTVLVAVGVADSLTDVAMNVSGIEVQRRLARPVLSSMHAVWSVGAVAGGAVGSLAAELSVPIALQAGVLSVSLAALVLCVARHVPDASGEGSGERTEGGPRLGRPLLLLCGLAVLAALVEDAPASWSAIYLVDHTGASPGVGGLAFTSFMAAMVVGRLLGDRFVARFGLVTVVRTGGAAAAVALAVALVTGGTAVAVVAFAVVGLGSASLFPAMFSAAGALPGQGIAAMNAASRVGFLLSPPLVGAVADAVGLSLALGLLVVPAALGLAVLGGAVRPAEARR